MNRLFLLVAFLVLGKISYSQYPISQNLGSDSTIVVSKGATQSRFVNVTYVDTAAANLQRIRQYPGAQIVTTGSGSTIMWIRNATATGWLRLPAGSATGNIYTIDGTLTGTRNLSGSGFPLTFSGLDKFVVSGDSIRFTAGNQSFALNTDSGSITKKLSYSGNYSGDFKQYTLVDKNYVDSIVTSSPAGTVTQINTSYGLLGGPITNTGTLSVDSATLSNYYLRRNDSLTLTNPLGYVTNTVLKDTASAIRSSMTAGTVTSVALTMPAAFNVAGSPITSSGTLAVTAAGLATQYIRGDGQLANFPGGGGGGGASVSYYLNGSVNQGTFVGNTYYQMNKTPVIGAGTNFTIAANGYIAQFITNASDPALLNIPAGNWNFEMWFSSSSTGGNPQYYVELYKYNGTTFSLIASSSASPESITGGTVKDLYITSLAVPATSLTLTDRLAVRVYVLHDGRTITLYTEDQNLCQVITTFTTGITALNGLTEQVQYFATGTSGTDFSISSASATHTFNLPTASATNRGALSTTDWTTFNNKVGGSGTSGQVAYFNGTNSITSSPTFTFTPTSQLLVNNSVTAASAIARGINATPSLTAAANNDVLVGLDINPTFTNGAFTGVTNYGLRSQARVFINPTIATTNSLLRITDNTNGTCWMGFSSTVATGFFIGTNGSLTLGQGVSADNTAPTGSQITIRATTGGRMVLNTNSANEGIQFSDGNNATIRMNFPSVNEAAITTLSNHNLSIGTAASSTSAVTNTMKFFAATNNVGINQNTDAGFRLDVNGTARATGLTSLVAEGATSLNLTNAAATSVFQNIISTVWLRTTFTSQSVTGVLYANPQSTTQGTFALPNSIGLISTVAGVDTHIGASTALGNNGGNISLYSGQNSSIAQGIRFFYNTFERVRIGNNNTIYSDNGSFTANASAIIQIESTTRGFLRSRMTTAQRDAISTPATGLSVYNTSTNTNDYYNGSAWVSQGSASGASGQVAYFSAANALTSSATFAFTPTSQLLVNNSVTAASAIARGINATPTLTAAANSDALIALDINPTYTNGAFTNLNNTGLRVFGSTITNNTTPSIEIRQPNATSTTYLSVRNQGFYGSGTIAADFGITGSAGGFFSSTVAGDIVLKGFSQAATSKFFIGTTSSNQLVLFPTNNVAIGTATDAGFRLDISGTARVQSFTTINATTAISGDAALSVNSTTNNSTGGQMTGINSTATVATNTGNFLGINSTINNSSTSVSMLGYNAAVNVSANTTTQARGFAVGGAVTGTGAVTTYVGYDYVDVFKSGSGAVTRQNAIRIANLTAGSSANIGILFNNAGASAVNGTWDIYSQSGNASYLAGNLLLGTTSDIGGRLQVAGTITATSAIARGVNFTNTLVAAANNDVLVGLDINPTFTNGAFTGVTNRQIRLLNTATVNADISFGLITGGGGYSSSFVQDGTGLTIGHNTNTRVLRLQTNSTSRIYVTGAGNVIVGSETDAGFRLDVNGTARVQGVLTTTADASINSITVGRGLGNDNASTVVGRLSLAANTSGIQNTAIGAQVLQNNTTGNSNTAVGWATMQSNVSGSGNTVYGFRTLGFITSGSNNIAIGFDAGRLHATGNMTISDNSIFLGYGVRALADNQTNQIVIGYTTTGLGSNTTVIGNSSTLTSAIYGNLLLGTTSDVAGRLQIVPANNTIGQSISGSSLTGSNAQSLVSLSQTWNTTGNPTAFLLNITNTASGATADLMELQVGGVAQFIVGKTGGGYFKDGVQIDPQTANTSALKAAYSVTGSNANSLFDLTPTWNTTGSPTAIFLNVTNTASGASSKLMDLQVGSVSQFQVTKGGAIQTDNPTGGTKKPWKLGSAGVTLGGSNLSGVEVEIDGVLYYLVTGYLPEPEPDPAAAPASGPSGSYKTYNKPTPVKSAQDAKIKELEEELAELKQMMKLLMDSKNTK